MRNVFLLSILFLFVLKCGLTGQVIFSEVMFDVVGSDYHDEYVEIYNLSTADSVDLTGWQFTDSSGTDWLTDAGFGLKLAPGQFGVILDGSYFANSGRYDDRIPEDALILTISDGAFGSNGLSNSVSERLSLIDAQGREVQVYHYSLDNAPGYSDEKIRMTGDNSPENWRNSLILGGTPGARNSVTPYDYDLSLAEKEAVIVHPDLNITSFSTAHVAVRLLNSGLNPFDAQVRLIAFLETKHDSARQLAEPLLVDSTFWVNAAQGEEWPVNFSFRTGAAGKYWLTLQLFSDTDMNPANNLFSRELLVLESGRSMVLNEIKFLTTSGEPEWVEILNTGSEPLNLFQWGIADEKDTARVDSLAWIYPGQYKVFTASPEIMNFYSVNDTLLIYLKHFPTLNNDGDRVYLMEPGGGWVEQTAYQKSWLEGEEWRLPSLERINPQLDSRLSGSWGPCTAGQGATPGARNSLFTDMKQTSSLTISPDPFSPDGDGMEDVTIIQVRAPVTSGRLRVWIFDVLGRRVRTLAENRFTSAAVSVVWDGRNDHGAVVRMGIYIIYLQILDDRNGILREYKHTVTVAKRLK